jgi:lipopolysaccharide/colanic/teichoic acid biosynthesis glycosyltransferase
MIYNLIKRFFDIVFSFIVLVILTPFFASVSLLLLFTGENEILYLQERIGHKNKKFKIWKFATMIKNSLSLGSGSITTVNDFRVTKVGKYLRKSKINELPQIINILKGDISIVGPRPLVENIFLFYSDEFRNKIYSVKPGLTGIGSIIFRDEESIISSITSEKPLDYYKRVISPYKGKLEMWYQSKRSFVLDSQLIFLTAWVIIFPETRIYERWFRDLPKRSF